MSSMNTNLIVGVNTHHYSTSHREIDYSNTNLLGRLTEQLLSGTTTFAEIINNNQPHFNYLNRTGINFSREQEFTSDQKTELLLSIIPSHPNFKHQRNHHNLYIIELEDYNPRIVESIKEQFPKQ